LLDSLLQELLSSEWCREIFFRMNFMLVATCILVLCSVTAEGKKKKKGKPEGKVNLFDSKTLNCLVCKSLVDEIEGAIHQVDPSKKVETGTFRLNGDGTQSRTLIPYARSAEHLDTIVDTVCKGFEDYAQAKYKASGKPTIIRLMTHEGNMNPKMSEVDMVPDDDLNTRLKFYCENIVEDQEEAIHELFSKGENIDIENEFCSRRAKVCEEVIVEEEYDFEDKDEL